jgi:hypothetical protein
MMAKRKGMSSVDRRADEAPKVEIIKTETRNCVIHGEQEVLTGNTKTGVLECGHLYVFAFEKTDNHGFVLAPPYRFTPVSMS